MPSPFPGMDPYIERSELWPDFHDRLITHTAEAIQPLVRPRYAALTQDRLYVVEHRRPIRPDISLVRTRVDVDNGGGTATAVSAEPDTPLLIEIVEEEIRQPLIHIIEPVADRIITAIEVLSPDNKRPGSGRQSYQRKCEELRQANANLVEIDLLREGERVLPDSAEEFDNLPRWHYVVAVTRRQPPRHELYTFALQQRLPRVAIPLANGDPDVVLDLQAVFTRCWNAGPYPELLRYDERPPGQLSPDDIAWCESVRGNG